MYNRYVPQEDGTHQKSKLSSPSQIPIPSEANGDVRFSPPPSALPQQESVHRSAESAPPTFSGSQEPLKPESITGFLRQILPQGFDTADLIVVLLLLLISEKDEEKHNTSLLTLVIYLFL